MKPTNQKQALLYYLQETGPVDFVVAAQRLGISQLTARIAELRREGWDFSKATTSGKNKYGNHFQKRIYSNPRKVA